MSVSTVHILEKTFDIICQRGIRSPRLYEIAQACGTSVRAIHALFRTKKDLVQAALERALEKNITYLQVNPVLSPSAVVELSNFFSNTERTLSKELKPNLLFEIKKYHTSVWNKIQWHKEKALIPYVQTNLIRGVSEGCYRDDFDHTLYASMYFDTLDRLVHDQYLTMANTIRLVNQLNRVFLHGILTPKGMRWLV